MAASFDGDFQLPGGSSHCAEDVVASVCRTGPGAEFRRSMYFLSPHPPCAHPPSVGNLHSPPPYPSFITHCRPAHVSD